MHIEKHQTNDTEYLRLVKTNRVKNQQGKSVNRKEIIKTFGALSTYDDG